MDERVIVNFGNYNGDGADQGISLDRKEVLTKTIKRNNNNDKLQIKARLSEKPYTYVSLNSSSRPKLDYSDEKSSYTYIIHKESEKNLCLL